MPFTLHPATTDDVSDIVAIYRAAFASDDIMGHFHPKAAASTLWEQDIQFYTDLIAQGSIYGERVTKAVDEETGKTVAFSAWQYPHTLTDEEEKKREAAIRGRRDEPPEGSNKELIQEFFRQIFGGRKRWIEPDKTFFLHILAVHPTYHRLGIGTQLIRPGLAAADLAGASTYIEASPTGLPLYRRHGWEPVDEMAIDMRPYGGQGIVRHQFLMREPSKNKG